MTTSSKVIHAVYLDLWVLRCGAGKPMSGERVTWTARYATCPECLKAAPR